MTAQTKDPKKPAAVTTRGAKKGKTGGAYDYRIPEGSKWAGLWKLFLAIGVLGLILSGVGYAMDPTRFAFSYLFAFMCALTVALGSLFFIIVERLTSAGWSVVVRRIAEFFASGFPALVVLFVPVLFSLGTLYPWFSGEKGGDEKAEEQKTTSIDLTSPFIGTAYAQGRDPSGKPHPGPRHVDGTHVGESPGQPGQHPSPPGGPRGGHAGRGEGGAAKADHLTPERQNEALEADEEQTLAKKAAYLSHPFFFARIALYFAAWLFIAFRMFGLSTSQDTSGDPALTRKAQSIAPVMTILFGLSLTFAVFDWVMSLEPGWSSTIFGVAYFAGCVVTIFATLVVVVMGLREEGLLKDAVTIEHFHDLGKLMFGFLVFWAYTNFSQFMLIWYAALPEEATFYHHRWDVGSWSDVSLLIVVAYFIIPFFLILSRNVKRRLPLLRIGAVWLLVMNVVQVYWLVMPNYNHGESTVSWIDFACLIGVVGVYLAVVFRNMTRYPLIPVKDPRLARSLAFQNA
jgi:hypothetical protein